MAAKRDDAEKPARFRIVGGKKLADVPTKKTKKLHGSKKNRELPNPIKVVGGGLPGLGKKR